MSPRRRRRIAAALVIAVIAALAAAALFLQSAMFREILRKHVVAAMERATGGRVELRRFSFEPGRLEVDLEGIAIHGRESAQEPPLFSARLIQADWKVLSLWGLRANLRSLRVWDPRVYVTVYQNGATNIPVNISQAVQAPGWVKEVLRLRVRRLAILRGQMHWRKQVGLPGAHAQFADQRFPLNFQAENFHLAVNYQPAEKRYSGKLDFQKAAVVGPAGFALHPHGRAAFALSARKAELKSLELQTAGSRLSAQGVLENFQSPHLQFRYRLALDWKEAAKFLGRRGWKGRLAWQGRVSYSDRQWRIEGPLEVRAAKMQIPWLRSLPWTGHAAVRLTTQAAGSPNAMPPPWRAEFKDIELALAGGRATGTATVSGTSSAATTRVDLRLEHLGVPPLFHALSQPDALASMRWAGLVSGPVQISFQDAGKNFAMSTDWRLDPPAVVPSGSTPVSGRICLNYNAAQKRLQTHNSYLNVAQTHLSADGWLGPQDSRLSIALDAPHFEDARPIVALLWKQSARLPVRLHGGAKASFLWTGGARSPQMNGRFRVTDFDYQNVRFDSLAGDFAFQSTGDSAGNPNGPAIGRELKLSSARLSRGGAVMQFNATLGLSEGMITPQTPFSIEASLHGAKISDLQTLLRTRFPAQGTLQGSFQASGTRENPQGEGNITVTSGKLYGESFERLAARVTLTSGGLVSARGVRIEKAGGTLQGQGSVRLKSRQYRFSLAGSRLPLESFRFFKAAQIPATGLLQLKLSGAGNGSRSALQGRMEITRLAVGGHWDGTISVGVNASAGQAHVQWKGRLLGGEVHGAGEARLQSPLPFSAHLEFANLDAGLLLPGGRRRPVLVRAAMGGSAAVQGNLKHPSSVHATGTLDVLAGSVSSVDFHNAEPVRFVYTGGMVQVEQVHLLAKDTDLEATASVRLARAPLINVKAKGHVNLAAFSALDPDLSTAGQVAIDARVGGTLRNPVWQGRLDFSDASVRYESLPNSLTRIQGALLFRDNRATLQNFTAESGGGKVKLGGLLTYLPESGLEMQLIADLAGVRIRYPEGVSTWVDGRLALSGSPRSSMLSGKVIVQKETASPEFDVGAALMSRKQQPLVDVRAIPLRNLRLDVQVVSATNVSLETSTAKNLRGDIDLRIRGTLEHPSWLGRISILEGDVTIGGRRFVADRGELTFSNPFRIEPTLNLRVRARVEQYDISLNFTGPLDRLTITYSSDPPLPSSEILALLVAGSSYSTSLQPSSTEVAPRVGANSLLSQALNQQVGSRLDRIFGSGRIRIDPQIAGFDRPANANVALEQHIKDNLTLLYVTNVTSAQQRIIQAEWTLNPRFSVTAMRDQNGLIGVNFQIKLRFR